MLEEIEGLLIDDPSLEFFLPFILEDLVLAYSLGIKGDLLVIPGKLYNRRVVTTPILKDNIVGDPTTGYKLVKNCFNRLTDEISETAKQVIEEYSENPITRRTLESFKQGLKGAAAAGQRKHSQDIGEHDEDMEDETVHEADTVLISKKDAKTDPKQADINLKAYETKTAQIEKELKDFASLTKKFSTFYARYGKSRRLAAPVEIDQNVTTNSFSYTAQEKILEMKLQGRHIRHLNRLGEVGNPASKLLIQLSNTIQRASSYLHGIRNLPEAHQVKVHDIMDVVVRAVDLEEEVLESYLKFSTPDNIPTKEDMAELAERVQGLWDIAADIETNKKYQMRKEAVDFEVRQAEADLAARMDKIRSRIYMSYNKSKMIAKQIHQLRARTAAR